MGLVLGVSAFGAASPSGAASSCAGSRGAGSSCAPSRVLGAVSGSSVHSARSSLGALASSCLAALPCASGLRDGRAACVAASLATAALYCMLALLGTLLDQTLGLHAGLGLPVAAVLGEPGTGCACFGAGHLDGVGVGQLGAELAVGGFGVSSGASSGLEFAGSSAGVLDGLAGGGVDARGLGLGAAGVASLGSAAWDGGVLPLVPGRWDGGAAAVGPSCVGLRAVGAHHCYPVPGLGIKVDAIHDCGLGCGVHVLPG
jgi:hypothetical protein